MDSSFPFLSRVVKLSPDQARAAFDALAGPAGGRIEVSGGHLEIGAPVPMQAQPGYWPFRRAQGHLRPEGSRRSVDVRLEVLPWSEGSVEVGLSVLETPRRGARRLGPAYQQVGPEVLDELALRLERSLLVTSSSLAA